MTKVLLSLNIIFGFSPIATAGCLYASVEYPNDTVLKQVTAFMRCDASDIKKPHWVEAAKDFASKRGCWFKDAFFLERSKFIVDGSEKTCVVSPKNDFSWR